MLGPKRRLSGKRILITGASSGIGRALALALARDDNKLLITARRSERLEELASSSTQRICQIECVPGDISDATVRNDLVQRATDRFGGLDILINNAGIGGIGTFASADATRLRRIMEVNFFSAVELTRQALPLLRTSADGVIVNVGSVLGHCAVPKKSEYCASKFALHGFTDALRIELATRGVDVLLVSPSTVSSEFFRQAMRSEGNAAVNRKSSTPDRVAEQIINAIRYGRREVVLSSGGKLLVWADRLAPGITSRLLQRFG